MTVWVTRTRPAAARTAARLHDLGLKALIDPVLAVRRLAVTLDLTGYDALAFTSGHAVAALAALTPDRALPAYAVGAATAEALREIGFGQVHSADGDVAALARLLSLARPGRVLAPGPVEPAGDLPGLALNGGVVVERIALYDTQAIAPEAAWTADLSGVLIHSPKAARALAAVAEGRLAGLPVFAISEAASEPLHDTPTGGLFIAPFPDEPSLLKLCAETLSETS